MRLILLTQYYSHKPIYLNPEQIQTVTVSKDGYTCLTLQSEAEVRVSESPEQIMHLIDQANATAMYDLQQCLHKAIDRGMYGK